MKTISTIALSALLIGSAGIADAGPLDFLFKKKMITMIIGTTTAARITVSTVITTVAVRA